MNTVQAKQLIKSWFESGDFPTEDQFDDFITSLSGAHRTTFLGSELVDGILTVTYGTTNIEVDGVEVATDIEITEPLGAKVYKDGAYSEDYPVIRVDDKSCMVNIGDALQADVTYTLYIQYYK